MNKKIKKGNMKKYNDIAVAWKNKDKNGKTYLSVKAVRDIKKGDTVNLFKNDKGDNPKRPDYRAYEVEEQEEEEEDSEKIAGDIPF